MSLVASSNVCVHLIGEPHGAEGFSVVKGESRSGQTIFQVSKNGAALFDLAVCSPKLVDHGHAVAEVLWRFECEKKFSETAKGIRWLEVGPFELPNEPLSALANGYNNWSFSPMLRKDEVLPKETDELQEYFGDAKLFPYLKQPGRFHSWGHSVLDYGEKLPNSILASVFEDLFFTVFEIDLHASSFKIWLDIEGFKPDKRHTKYSPLSVILFPVNHTQSATLEMLSSQWRSLCHKYEVIERIPPLGARPVKSVRGFCSWYDRFNHIDQDYIAARLNEMAMSKSANENVFQIDDGYQKTIGDWNIPAEGFKDGIESSVLKIVDRRVTPGIWIAPFVAMEFSELVKDHPEFLVRDENGSPVVCGDFAHWGGKFLALETEHEGVRSYLESVIDRFAKAGVKLIKADFLYASSMIPRFGKTRAELGSRAHQWFSDICYIRGIQLLSCGSQFSTALGRCDYLRVGPDFSPHWHDVKEGHASREKPSVPQGVVNTLTRYHLDGHFVKNDPDVVLFRKENTTLTLGEKKTLGRINGTFGSLVFCSDAISEYTSEETNIAQEFEQTKKAGSPVSLHRVSTKKGQSYLLKTKDTQYEVTAFPRESFSIKTWAKTPESSA